MVRHPTSRTAISSLIVVTLFAWGAPPAAADTPQTIPDQLYGGTVTINFDHRAGNEWWVEVNITTSSGEPPHFVEARSETGSFQPLTLRSWGNWAASFHIPPGERVQFHASRQHPSGKFDQWAAYSCYFTHPQGVEQCDAHSTDPTTFGLRAPSGNNWWQQINVDSNRPVGRVWFVVDDVKDYLTYDLTKRSWGAWATSLNVPQGSTIQFWANNGADGAGSACFRWVQATLTDCAPRYGPQPQEPFMTRFDHKGGNEWWVETKIGPIDPTRVYASDDEGNIVQWTPLTLRSWGNWAGSFHIEPGHRVHFQAYFDDPSGPSEVRTSCWFTHPQGLSPDGAQICRNIEYGA